VVALRDRAVGLGREHGDRGKSCSLIRCTDPDRHELARSEAALRRAPACCM
jgi:hypothetical protein